MVDAGLAGIHLLVQRMLLVAVGVSACGLGLFMCATANKRRFGCAADAAISALPLLTYDSVSSISVRPMVRPQTGGQGQCQVSVSVSIATTLLCRMGACAREQVSETTYCSARCTQTADHKRRSLLSPSRRFPLQ